MQHRKDTFRSVFRYTAFRRVHPAAIVSAAVLAVGAMTGGLLTGPQETDPVNTGNKSGVLQAAALDTEWSEAAPAASGGPAASSPAVPAAPVPVEKPKPPSEKVLEYDFQYQPNFYYCGPASTRIALSGQDVTIGQDELARKLGTTVNGTDSSHDIARVLNAAVGGDAYRVREIRGQAANPAEMDRLQADVVDAVGNGRILVANIVGSGTDTSGYSRSFPGGHYVTIVGYSDDGRRVQVADPSGVGPASYWMTTIGMAHWMASRGYTY